jgi:DNA-binding response OmpR family regulator
VSKHGGVQESAICSGSVFVHPTGYEAALDTGTVTVHIRRLRAKLEPDPSRPRFLETLWGVGYRFAP